LKDSVSVSASNTSLARVLLYSFGKMIMRYKIMRKQRNSIIILMCSKMYGAKYANNCNYVVIQHYGKLLQIVKRTMQL